MFGYGYPGYYGNQGCGYGYGENNGWIWIVLIIFIIFFLCWGNNSNRGNIGCC